jgi:hypothetical protein
LTYNDCDEVKIKPGIALPGIITSTTPRPKPKWGNCHYKVFFSTYFDVSQLNGVSINGFIASVDKTAKVFDVIDLDRFDVEYSPPDFYFNTEVRIKHMFTLAAHFKIENGDVVTIGGSLEHQMGWPIGPYPPASIFRINGGGMEFTNLNEPSNLKMDIYGILRISKNPIPIFPDWIREFRAKIGGTFEFGKNLNLGFYSNIYLFEQPMAQGEIKLYLSPPQGIVNVDINLAEMVKGHASLSACIEDGITLKGYAKGAVCIPQIVGPFFLSHILNPNNNPLGQCFSTPSLYVTINKFENYLAGRLINLPFINTLYFTFSLPPYSTQIKFTSGLNYDILPVSVVLQFGDNPIEFVRRFNVTSSSESLVIEAGNSDGLPDYEIVLPDSSIINTDNYFLYNNIAYIVDSVKRFAFYHIDNPVNGNYYVQASNIDENTLKIYKAKAQPYIKITDIQKIGDSIFTLQMKVSDPDGISKISLGIDHDNNGVNGDIFAYNLYSSTTQYSLKITDTITHGDYFFYAMIEDLNSSNKCNFFIY